MAFLVTFLVALFTTFLAAFLIAGSKTLFLSGVLQGFYLLQGGWKCRPGVVFIVGFRFTRRYWRFREEWLVAAIHGG
jgi:hypothetical protein